MRISDWSSDVCSSDLARRFRIQYGSEGIGADGEGQGNVQPIFVGAFDTVAALRSNSAGLVVPAALAGLGAQGAWIGADGPWWLARACVVQGTSGSVRVSLGGRRIL